MDETSFRVTMAGFERWRYSEYSLYAPTSLYHNVTNSALVRPQCSYTGALLIYLFTYLFFFITLFVSLMMYLAKWLMYSCPVLMWTVVNPLAIVINTGWR